MTGDRTYEKCLEIVEASGQPLHTQEIVRKIPGASNYVIKSRLVRLMSEGRISGRALDISKGVWIWWPRDAFAKQEVR